MDRFIETLPKLTAKEKTPALVVGAAAGVAVVSVQLFTNANPIGRCLRFWKQLGAHESKLSTSKSVDEGITAYSDLHRNQTVEKRNASYDKLVNAYYDLATVFYEWGWGSSFHFSYQYKQESFDESIRRHEYYLAAQLDNLPASTAKVLDVGCGIGGPLRNISRFLKAQVIGITLNEYQVQRGNELTQADVHCKALDSKLVQGDFMKLPFEPATFDGAYAIEATCHAPDRVKCYQQIYQALKPGATFCCYEWCMTDKYDSANPEHLRMKKDIEEGNGLPDICDTTACKEALIKAGFELVRHEDLALVEHVTPWYTPLTPSWNVLSQRFQFNWLGSIVANSAIYLMEVVRIAPKGTVKTQKILQAGGFALRDAGQEGIFTTMYLMVGKKPLK